MNVIILTGNATKDIEIRYNPSGTPIGTGTIAVKRDYKNQNGEYETDFHNFVAIGKISEVMANHVSKGDKFGIKGKLQNRVWEKDNGEKRYFTEVLVDGFDFPTKPKNNQSSNQQRNDDNPFSNGQPIDISDGDLPF